MADTIDDRFPDVEWREPWPQNYSIAGVAAPMTFALVFLGMAVALLVMVPNDAGWVPKIGSWGAALMMLGVAAGFAGKSAWPRLRSDSGIRCHVDEKYGPGIKLRIGNSNEAIASSALLGCAIYGMCAWLDWRAGGSNLLPLSRSNEAAAVFILVIGSVAAALNVFLLFVLRWKIKVEVYPAGLVRKTELPFGRSRSEYVPWEEVNSLNPTTFTTGTATNPVIEIELLDSTVQPRNKLFDRPGVLGLPMHLTRCDHNTLFSILHYLKGQSGARHLLASSDMPAWFSWVEGQHRTRAVARSTRKGNT